MKLKKLISALAVFTAIYTTSFAFDAKTFWKEYEPGLKKGTLLPQAAIGFGSGPAGFKMQCPTISLSADYCLPIKEFPLSFGGEFNFKSFGYSDSIETRTALYWNLLARAMWHFNFDVKNLDVYAGSAFGIKGRTIKYEVDSSYGINLSSSDSSNTYFDFGILLGARYFFNDLVGAFIETGYGFSYVKLGATFKFDL